MLQQIKLQPNQITIALLDTDGFTYVPVTGLAAEIGIALRIPSMKKASKSEVTADSEHLISENETAETMTNNI